jgi:hypothetical protein
MEEGANVEAKTDVSMHHRSRARRYPALSLRVPASCLILYGSKPLLPHISLQPLSPHITVRPFPHI